MTFVDKIKKALAEVGYLANDFLAAQAALLLYSSGESVRAILLDGEPGAGKTEFADAIAKVLGAKFMSIQVHSGSMPEDFLFDTNLFNVLMSAAGDTSAVQESKDVIQLGFLPLLFKASQEGLVVGLIDEIDKSDRKTDGLFLTALQKGEVEVKGYGIVKANKENLVVVITKNDERAITKPLMRRLRRHYLTFLEGDIERTLLLDKVQKADKPSQYLETPKMPVQAHTEELVDALIKIADQLRYPGKRIKVIKPPSMQELKQSIEDLQRLHQWGLMDLAGPVVANWLAGFEKDKKVLQTLYSDEELTELLKPLVKAAEVVHTDDETDEPVKPAEDEYPQSGHYSYPDERPNDCFWCRGGRCLCSMRRHSDFWIEHGWCWCSEGSCSCNVCCGS